MLFHIIQQVIQEAAVESLVEDKRRSKGDFTIAWDTLSPDQCLLGSLISAFVKETIYESIHERIALPLLDTAAQQVLNSLITDIVADDIMMALHNLHSDNILEFLIEEIIKKEVWIHASRICSNLKVSLKMERPVKPKSKAVDSDMDNLFEILICEELVLALNFPFEEEIDHLVDQNILECLVDLL
jgi:hypothetical protein